MVWGLDDLSLAGARVLAEQHDLGLAVGLAASLHVQQVLQVGAVHGEDVVETVEVVVGDLAMLDMVSMKVSRAGTYLAGRVLVISDAMVMKSGHGPAVGVLAGVVAS